MSWPSSPGVGEPDFGLDLRTVTEIDDFAALGERWDSLVARMPRPSPFLLSTWLIEWWKRFSGRSMLRVVVVGTGGTLSAGIPLMVTKNRGVRVLQILGAPRTVVVDVVAASGRGTLPDQVFGEALAGDDYDAVLFSGLSDGSLLDALVRRGARTLSQAPSPVMDILKPWHDLYMEKTSSKGRNTAKRKLKRLAALGRIDFRTSTSPAEVSATLEDCFVVHRLGWSWRHDRSIFGTESGQQFYRAVTPALAKQGGISITTLYVDGKPIAFDYCFVVGDTMFLHRLAFDPRYAEHSPGLLTTLHTIAEGASAGIRRFEFMGGANAYKVALADRFEPLVTVSGLPQTATGRLYSLGLRAEAQARRRLGNIELARKFRDRLRSGTLGPHR